MTKDLNLEAVNGALSREILKLQEELKHWPGMWRINAVDFEGKIILPLPTENTNAEG